MARGFGATYGAGTTDLIQTALTSTSTQRSYAIRFYRNGTGGGGGGRLFTKNGEIIWLANNSTMQISQTFSGSTASWTYPYDGNGVWYSTGFSYDYSSTSNDPVCYVEGASVAVTETVAPSGTASTTSDPLVLGNRVSDSGRNWDGMFAEFAVWDALLTAAEFRAHHNGMPASRIRPSALASYEPMLRQNVNGKHAASTITGTVVQPHVRVIMFLNNVAPGIAAAASTKFSWWAWNTFGASDNV